MTVCCTELSSHGADIRKVSCYVGPFRTPVSSKNDACCLTDVVDQRLRSQQLVLACKARLCAFPDPDGHRIWPPNPVSPGVTNHVVCSTGCPGPPRCSEHHALLVCVTKAIGSKHHTLSCCSTPNMRGGALKSPQTTIVRHNCIKNS